MCDVSSIEKRAECVKDLPGRTGMPFERSFRCGTGKTAVVTDVVQFYKGRFTMTITGNIRTNWKRILFSFITGLITVLVFSACSPLYAFNPWDDSNCFFTVGRAIINGRVPYRDIYEQKGPLLYFIHALAALVSSRSFLGVYFIQTVICAVTHYCSIKIASLYTQVTSRLMILSVPLMMLLYSVNAYYYGDSAEEMLLPFFAVSLYIVLRSFKENSLPGKKETVIIAIGSAWAFWIKYTLCGFFLGTVIIFLVNSIRKKQFKKLLELTLTFIITFLAAAIPILIYFAANNALGDLFTSYFYNNIFLYKNVNETIPLTGVVPYAILVTAFKLRDNPYLIVMLLISVIFFIAKKRYAELLAYMTLFFFTIVFIFNGSFIGFYYIFAVAVFTLPALAGIEVFCSAFRINKAVIIPLSAVLAAMAFFFSIATSNISAKKADYPQFVFADYIKDYPGATLLEYDFMDQGFYTAAGIVPSEKFFCALNIDSAYDEARLSKETAISEHRVDFVVTKNHFYNLDGYEPVASMNYTGKDFNNYNGTDAYYLYKRVP